MTESDTASLLQPFRDRPGHAVLFTDFDGTISPIVDLPEEATLLEGAADVLVALSSTFLDLVVVSGRPVDFLARHVPADVSLVGLYGLEGRQLGHRWEHPRSGTWREVVGDVAGLAAVSGPPGMRVEPKGLSLTLHYRNQPALADAVIGFAQELSERSGLEVRPARMSVELHPPVATDKGMVVERFAANAEAALYIGDDAGDLPAFDALDRLAAAGVAVARIGVRSSEAPAAVLDRADLLLDGPAEVVDLLRSLVPVS